MARTAAQVAGSKPSSRWNWRSGSVAAITVGVLVATGILAATIWVAFNDQKSMVKAEQGKAELLARVLDQQTTSSLETGFLALTSLSESQVLNAAVVDHAKGDAVLSQALSGIPFLRSLVLIDSRGVVVASSGRGEVGLPIDLNRLGPMAKEGRDSLGPYIVGRSIAILRKDGVAPPPPSGIGFIPLMRGFSNDQGKAMVLVGLLNPDSFSNQQKLSIGEEQFHSMLLAYTGQVLAASRQGKPAGGDLLNGLPVFQDYLPAREHASYLGKGLDPGRQIVAFRASRTLPLVVMVEESYDDAVSRWLNQAIGYIAAGATAVVLVLVFAVAVWRSLRGREMALRQTQLAQQRIAESERELAVLMRSVQELIFRTDVHGTITFVNARWAILSGTRAATAIGKPLTQVVEPACRDAVAKLFTPSIAGVRTCQADVKVDGSKPLKLELAVVPLMVGNVVSGYAGSAIDVTDKVVAQAQLHGELALRELLLELNPLPISMTDFDGRLIFVNKAWEIYKGRPRAQVIGKRPGDFLPADEVTFHSRADQMLLKGRQSQVSFETPISHSDGTRHDTRVIKATIPDQNGRPSGILSTLMDISEFRAAERATQEARDASEEAARSKAEFVANMSHELRTPLQSILGFSELGALRGKDSPRLAGMFEDIHSAGAHMLALVNDLLDVAKIESTVGTFHLERLDLRGVIWSLAREMEPLLTKHQLHFDVHFSEDPLVAKADPIRFKQAIRNVVANAIRFSPPSSTIELSGQVDTYGQIHFVVRDSGPGIPEGELETIFEPFVQSSKTKDGSGGTGLGLAICRKILEAMGGKIYARNASRGGASFHILMPTKQSGDTVPAPL
jgi:PAS domain S-box-containing protein